MLQNLADFMDSQNFKDHELLNHKEKIKIWLNIDILKILGFGLKFSRFMPS